MKKILTIICFFVINNTVFSQINVPNFIRFYQDDCYYVGYNNQLFECNIFRRIYRNITDLCYIDNNGYLRIDYKISNASFHTTIREVPYYLILAPRQLFVLMSDQRIGVTNLIPDYLFPNIFIDSISSNSFLIENSLEYSPQNFLKRFFRTDMGFPYEYWSRALPLAISQEQMSTFEMEITFQNDVEGILLLNGFVDFSRPHLYNNNRRIRELKIIDKNNGFEQNYFIEDRIEFQELIFPKLTNGIVIKIISYYEGNRYTDICCSSIIPIYNAAMFSQARLSFVPDYDSFIKEMFENYREIQ